MILYQEKELILNCSSQSNSSENALITKMARELNIDFSICRRKAREI